MNEWLSISQLSAVTGIPETTVRRYTNKFMKYFRYEKRSRGKKFHPSSVELLNRIASLYASDYEAVEIERLLERDFPMTIDDNQEPTIQPPVKSIEQQFNEFREQQEDFNKQLLQQITQQQEYIKNSLEKRDRELTETMNKMLESKKEIVSTQESKKWWRFWKKSES